MARSRTLIISAAILVAAGGAAWFFYNRTPPTHLDMLREKVRSSPGDLPARVALITYLLDTAEKDSLAAVKDDVLLMGRKDLSPEQQNTQGDQIKARYASSAALSKEGGEVIAAGLAQKPARLELVLLAVRHHLTQGNWTELKAVIDKARLDLTEAKSNREISEGMIVACYFLHQMFEGGEEAKQLIALDKENALAMLALTRVAQLRGDVEYVDRTLDECGAHAPPKNPYALAIYGGLLRDRSHLEEARNKFIGASMARPFVADFHYLTAAVYRRMGDEIGAAFEYYLIKRMNPDDPYVYVGLAETAHNQHDDARAVEILRVAASKAPNDPAILTRFAEFLSGFDDEKTLALAGFYVERADKASGSQDFEILRLWARICAKGKRFTDAVEKSKKARDAAIMYGARSATREINEDIVYYQNLRARAPRNPDDPQEPEQLGPMPETDPDPAAFPFPGDEIPTATAPARATAPATSPAAIPVPLPATLPSTRP